MDKVNKLENAIITALNTYLEKWKNPQPSPYHLVIDKENKRYVLFEMGFEDRIFYHFPVFHLAINNDKIWIFEDKSEEGLADLLQAQGVSQDDIVLGYFSEAYRAIADLAA